MDAQAQSAQQQQQQGQEGQQTEWTPEQIAAYYQQYGYYDYSQYYGQQQTTGTEGQPTDPSAQATTDASAMDPNAAYMMYQQSGYDYSAQQYGYGMYPGGYPPMRPPGGQEPTRSIWVGNVHPDTTEAELHAVFGAFGLIESIKMLPAKTCAFIKYVELDSAIQAHSSLIGVQIHGQTVKVGWGKAENTQREESGPPPCRNLWLGNIGPEVTEEMIYNTFVRYGRIEKIRILPQKNCAFVNFVTMDSAMQAKQSMSGVMMGERPLKINYGRDTTPGFLEGGTPVQNGPPPPPKPVRVEPPPQEFPPPEDAAMKGVIDKMAEFVARNGLQFEYMMQEKQKDNPKFGFLEATHELNGYYKFKLWCCRHPDIDPHNYEQIMQQQEQQYEEAMKQYQEQQEQLKREQEEEMKRQQQASQSKPQAMYGAVPPPSSLMAQTPSSSKYSSSKVEASNEELKQLISLIDNLVPTKESIKITKTWIIQHPHIAKDIAAFLRSRSESSRGFDQRLNLVYLIHDILHHSSRSRERNEPDDEFSIAFQPHLGAVLRLAYQGESPENQEKVAKVLRIWDEKRIFDSSMIKTLEDEMKGRGSSRSHRDYDRRDRSRDRDDYRDRDYRDRDRDDYRRGDDYRDRGYRDRDDRSDRKRDRDRDYDRYESKRRH